MLSAVNAFALFDVTASQQRYATIHYMTGSQAT
jgi:hypothetical protein